MEKSSIPNNAHIFRLFPVLALILALIPSPVTFAGTCGTGTWTSGNLEVHHINIGQGDSTLIVGPTGKSLLFDAGESYWNSSADAQVIGPYVESVLGCKSLDYVLISHFHVDHIGYVGYGGLWHLAETQGFTVGTTLVRNYSAFLGDISGTFSKWRTYLEGPGQAKLHPIFADEGSTQVNLGPGVTFDIVALDGNGGIIAGDFSEDTNPPSENDYSIGAVLSYGSFDEWIGGDLDGKYQVSGFGYSYHDIELSTAAEVGDVDVYRVNHHGSSHSNSATFISQVDPEVSIISVGNGNSYGHPGQTVMDRLLATSTVYLTERGNLNTNIGSAIVAGHIVIKTSNGSTYTVNGAQYTATEPTRPDSDEDGYFAGVDPNDGNSSILPSPNGGCGPTYQNCSVNSVSCQATPGQVLINEFLPSPSNNGTEWVELYNTTTGTVNIGYCYIDDIAGGSPPYQIPASTFIPPHGFWTLDRNSYFNNTGDDVRLLKEDGTSVLDSYTYGSTGSNLSRYRLPDGGTWTATPTSLTTKGQTNTLPFYPIVMSITRTDPTPTSLSSVRFDIAFSKPVSGVDVGDFTLTASDITGAAVTAVSGSGATRTITVNTGSGVGSLRLDLNDNDTIKDSGNHPLGGTGNGNGSFSSGEVYAVVIEPTNIDLSIGPFLSWNYSLNPHRSQRTSYAGVNAGPVQIESLNITPILASQSVLYGGVSYSEMMGLPFEQLSQEFLFPYYNNVAMSSQLRVSNLGGQSTTITVFLGTQQLDSFPLGAGAAERKSYPGANNGPLRVVSSTTDILTTIRVLYGSKSYSELMGYPLEELSQEYWYPVYDNVSVNSQLRVSNVGDGLTTISIYLGTQKIDEYDLLAGEASRKTYPHNGGPLHVVSSAEPILSTIRLLYNNNSYAEITGLPAGQLSQQAVYPVYDNVSLGSQLRVANVGANPTTITVNLKGVQIDSFELAAGSEVRKSYPKNNGPLQVTSSIEPIVTSIRHLYTTATFASFYELMGLPNTELSTQYFFPWYNNTAMNSELRFAVP